MELLKLIKKLMEKLKTAFFDLLIPEDQRIKRLLDLPIDQMRHLLTHSPVLMQNAIVLFDYQNRNARLLVKSVKYKNHPALRKRLAVYLYEELIDWSAEINLFSGQLPLLLPMPMSKKEREKRGFNQCEELIKEIAKMENPHVKNFEIDFNILQKVRETERQTKMSREARAQNVKNSMAVAENQIAKIKNRTCIVLDDVYTTGATFGEARRALLASGARSALGLFIAH